MKKFIFLLALLCITNSVSAAEVSKINVGCTILESNLGQSMRDTASSKSVTAIQKFLKDKHYLQSEATGFFGPQTLKAVKAFQADNHINPTGYIGPLSRSLIQKISCVEPKVVAPVSAPVVIPAPISLPEPVVASPVAPVVTEVEDSVIATPAVSSLKVKTESVENKDGTSFLARGSITAGVRPGTERWFELTKNPTVYTVRETTLSKKVGQSSNSRFDSWFYGLSAGTTYYYRACAGNAGLGLIACGDTVSVTLP